MESQRIPLQHTYPIEIKHLFVSPGHNYFGRPKAGPGDYPTHDAPSVEVRAGKGIVGDRYFGVAAHFEAQITFLAWEVFQALLDHFDLGDLSPVLARRNVVIQGANLNQLIGQQFALVSDGKTVHFEGTRPCSPCAWMDAALTSGAHAFLRGRGGLRARVLSDGYLYRGPGQLQTGVALDLDTILEPIQKPNLP